MFELTDVTTLDVNSQILDGRVCRRLALYILQSMPYSFDIHYDFANEAHMDFQPGIHTKNFLLENLDTLFSLANESPEFAVSHLASDIDLLIQSLPDDDDNGHEVPSSNWKLAHALASSQPEWLNSIASADKNVLLIEDDDGWTVAHSLAKHQGDWINTAAAKDMEILLRRTRSTNRSVIGTLAQHQSEWVSKLTKADLKTLCLVEDTKTGLTIADLAVIHQHEALSDDLLNDTDFLTIKSNQLAPNWLRSELTDGYLAHLVAACVERWMLMPAAKDLSVLTLSSKEGFCVAHCLAMYQLNWLNTSEAKSDRILQLKTIDGLAVAHALAATQKLRAGKGLLHIPHPYAESIEHLKLMRKDHSGLMYSLAHDLCVNDKEWASNSKSAFSKDVLNMLAVKDDTEQYALSVAEQMIAEGMPFEEVVMRIIHSGAAFKNVVASKYKAPSANTLHLVADQAFEFANESAEPGARLKIYIALYSTMMNLLANFTDAVTGCASDVIYAASEKLCRDVIARSESLIIQSLAENPDLFHQLHGFSNSNCESGIALIEKVLYQRQSFSAERNTGDNEREISIKRGL